MSYGFRFGIGFTLGSILATLASRILFSWLF